MAARVWATLPTLLMLAWENSAVEALPAATEPHSERISGLIERVTFFNEDSGFCVLRVKAPGHRDLVTVVGSSLTVCAGEWLTAEGAWVRDKEHGLQLKATVLRTVPPTTPGGIERYLGSGMVKGIGRFSPRGWWRDWGGHPFRDRAPLRGTGNGGRHRTQAPHKDQTVLGGGQAGP